MWSNLKKTADMVVGQIGFHSERAVRKTKVEKNNSIVSRLNKTKIERKDVDLREERETRDRLEREKQKKVEQELRLKLEKEKKAKQELAKLKSYETVMVAEKMTTNNKDCDSDLSDDFM